MKVSIVQSWRALCNNKEVFELWKGGYYEEKKFIITTF